MVAITFSDVVVSHESFSDGLLFHELVHVEQYRQLGIPRFSELYVTGFPNGGSYDAIPLGSMRTRSAVALNKIPQGYSPWVMKCKIGLPKDDYDERFGQRTSSRHRPHGAGYLADRPKRVQELVC
jgi:hypothetical protein